MIFIGSKQNSFGYSHHILRACFLLIMTVPCYCQKTVTAQPEKSKYSVQFVQVQPGVKLEVLDYGGRGQPMIFLSALGSNAHDWDVFAPKFTVSYHVYAITRRGFGASDVPAVTNENYDANRLGDDVLVVMEKLKLDRPILVGWSLGGEELSSVGSRFPDKVKALVYLDAGYPYAFYNSTEGEPGLDRAELRRLLEQAAHEMSLDPELERKLLTSMAQNTKELRDDLDEAEKAPPPLPPDSKPQSQATPPTRPTPPPQMIAIMNNGVKYTKIPVPILAIFALPADASFIKDPVERAAAEKNDTEFRTVQVDAFKAGLPNAHVLTIAHAGHDIFTTNETEVFSDMVTFLKSLDHGIAQH